MPTTVPTLDLRTWQSATATERKQIAMELDGALQQTGMFLLGGHDIPADLTERIRAQGRDFFRMPVRDKRKYSVDRPYDNGWRGLGKLQVGAIYGEKNAPDLHEAYHVGPTHQTGVASHDELYYPPNKWPSEVPQLQKAATEYTAHMVRVALQVLEVFAEVLNLRQDFFSSQADHATWTQNVNWYPSLKAVGRVADGQMRVGPHSDYGTLTLLDRQKGKGGLQVWNEQDDWFTPPHEPGMLAVLLGDLMNLWTDGRWRALRHRVLAPPPDAPDEELVSLVFFFEANPEARIVPLAAPVGGGAGMSPALAGETILEKVGVSVTLAEK